MTDAVREWRTDLPVDVLEEDGIYTRAYLQALLENGEYSVYLDRKEDPVLTVPPEAIYHCHRPDRKDAQLGRFFREDTEIHALLRYAASDSERLHPATVLKSHFRSAFSVRFPNGIERKRFIQESRLPDERFRHAVGSDRKNLRLHRVTLAVPTGLEEAMEQDKMFMDKLQRQLNCFFLGVEETGRTTRTGDATKCIRLLLPRSTSTNSSRDKLIRRELSRRLVQLIADVLTVNAKRSLKLVEDEPAAKRTCRDGSMERRGNSEPGAPGDGDSVDANAHRVFHIPELVNKIIYFMNMVQRHTLRSVCSLWYHQTNSRSVKRLARYDIIMPETPDHIKYHNAERLTTLFRCFNPHLETFVFYFDLSTFDKGDKPYFIADYCHLIEYIKFALRIRPWPSLKKIVFSGGYISQQLVADFLFLPRPMTVVLRKMFVQDPGVRYQCYCRSTVFSIYVEAGQIGGFTLLPENMPTRTDQMTPQLVRNYIKRKVEAFDTVAKFLAGFMDQTPVSAEDIERIRVAIAKEWEKDLTQGVLEYVLKTLDPQFVEGTPDFPSPLLTRSLELCDPSPPRDSPDFRNLNLVALRPSTLKFFVVNLDLYGPDEHLRELERKLGDEVEDEEE